MAKRTKIFSDQLGYVTVRQWDDIKEKYVETTYVCPENGGYVRNSDTGHQICDGLERLGDTLECNNLENLLTLIRKEYRKSTR